MLFFDEPIAALPIAASEYIALDSSPYAELVDDDNVEGIFLLELALREIESQLPAEAYHHTLCEMPIAGEHFSSEPMSTGEIFQIRYFSDVDYTTRPHDKLAKNRSYAPRIISALDFSERSPRTPEGKRRVVRQSGSFRLSAADNELDSLVHDYTVRGQVGKLRLLPRWKAIKLTSGPLVDIRQHDLEASRQIAEVYCNDWKQDRGEVEVTTNEPEFLLSRVLNRFIYGGTGGADGIASLAGIRKPVVIGKPWNVTPRLISEAFWIYQAHFSALDSIFYVRDKGVRLTFTADYPTYAALALAPLNIGEYATCLAEGMFRLGGEPAGKVTCDPAVAAVSAQEVMTEVALEYALLDPGSINFNSFPGPLIGQIGIYYDGSSEVKCENVYDQILGPVDGFYGDARDRRLSVRYFPDPATTTSKLTILDGQIKDFVRDESTVQTRRSQSVNWGRNWTVMDESDLASIGVDPDERELLKREWPMPALAESSEAGRVDVTAKDFGPLDSPYVLEADARTSAQRVVKRNRRPARAYNLTIGRRGLDLVTGDKIEIFTPRYDFENGGEFAVVEYAWTNSGSETLVQLSLEEVTPDA